MSKSLPLVAPALGAMLERLAGVERARLLPPGAAAERWNDALIASAQPGVGNSEVRS